MAFAVVGGSGAGKCSVTEILSDVNFFKRIPKDALDNSLSDLSNAAKTALKNEILDMGYTLQEVNNRFPGDLGDYTLRDVLRFMATRRRKPRYDSGTDEIVLDGEEVGCEDVDALDRVIT